MESMRTPAHEDTEEVRRFIEACRRREAELGLRQRGSDQQPPAQDANLVRLLLEYIPPSESWTPKRGLVARLLPPRLEWR